VTFKKIKKRLLRKLGLMEPPFEKKMAPLVEKHANEFSQSSIQNHVEKRLFIDMGSNLGQGFQYFSKFYSPNLFDFLFFEANPNCIDQLESNIRNLYEENKWSGKKEIINAAISNADGTVKLYGLVEDQRGKLSDGASTIKDHNSIYYEACEHQAIEVPSINISELIKKYTNEYSTIIVKMDIESSEYDSLEDLISTNTINDITHLYVEWHSQYYSENKKSEILEREKNLKNILANKLTNWH